MKKVYLNPSYVKWHRNRLLNSNNIQSKIKKRILSKYKGKTQRHNDFIHEAILAPIDFRTIENTDKCMYFFRNVRDRNNWSFDRGKYTISINLKHVKQIDYATISILTALSNDLKYKDISLKGNFPDDPECKNFIIDSGFLKHMFTENNRKFDDETESVLVFFENGSDKLSEKDNRNIGELVKKVVGFLTGDEKHFGPVKTVLLEICGNSIEHAYIENKHWLLGVMYKEKKVIFTVTDVGKGILKTLYIKHRQRLAHTFGRKSDIEILKGAFEQKYGSSTREVNRNKGLPAVKNNFEIKTISSLIVITNNVILHFDDNEKSRTFLKGSPWFHGTLYQWEMTRDSIETINI